MPKKIFSILFVSSFILILFVSFYIFQKPAMAGTADNLSGFAWSENIGWISFNCTNNNSCNIVNYGVSVNPQTGVLSGFAWSENIGWIKFDPVGPYPSQPQTGVTLNTGTGTIFGWARACAGTVNGDCNSVSRTDGWDGWIKMAGGNYSVVLNGNELHNWAWGSDVMGWIHFKGSNYGVIYNGGNKTPSVSFGPDAVRPPRRA